MVVSSTNQTRLRIASSPIQCMACFIRLQEVMKSGTAAKSASLGWKKNRCRQDGDDQRFSRRMVRRVHEFADLRSVGRNGPTADDSREGIRLGIGAPHLGRHHAECPRESLSSGTASAAGADGGGGNLLRLWSAGDLRMYRKQDRLPDASPRFGSTEVHLPDSSGTGDAAGRPAATPFPGAPGVQGEGPIVQAPAASLVSTSTSSTVPTPQPTPIPFSALSAQRSSTIYPGERDDDGPTPQTQLSPRLRPPKLKVPRPIKGRADPRRVTQQRVVPPAAEALPPIGERPTAATILDRSRGVGQPVLDRGSEQA
jgi:hypothetical protein